MKNLLFVGIGGAIGSIFRYMISVVYQKYNPVVTGFPYPTFIANILGCIFIGILMAVFLKNTNANIYKLILVTGFCGGFTTFSTFSYESIELFQSNHFLTAFIYVILTLIIGFLFTYLSFYIMK